MDTQATAIIICSAADALESLDTDYGTETGADICEDIHTLYLAAEQIDEARTLETIHITLDDVLSTLASAYAELDTLPAAVQTMTSRRVRVTVGRALDHVDAQVAAFSR